MSPRQLQQNPTLPLLFDATSFSSTTYYFLPRPSMRTSITFLYGSISPLSRETGSYGLTTSSDTLIPLCILHTYFTSGSSGQHILAESFFLGLDEEGGGKTKGHRLIHIFTSPIPRIRTHLLENHTCCWVSNFLFVVCVDLLALR